MAAQPTTALTAVEEGLQQVPTALAACEAPSAKTRRDAKRANRKTTSELEKLLVAQATADAKSAAEQRDSALRRARTPLPLRIPPSHATARSAARAMRRARHGKPKASEALRMHNLARGNLIKSSLDWIGTVSLDKSVGNCPLFSGRLRS